MEKTLGQDFWLVRTSLNELRGPMSREALIQEIRTGVLHAQDEVCRANGYWIYLDERDEVSRQLGIELPKGNRGPGEEEITDTETMTQELQASALSTMSESEHAQLESTGDGGSHETKMLSNRNFRRLEPASSNRTPSGVDRRKQNDAMKPLILGRVEQPSFWRYVIAALIILTGVLVAWVIRVLQLSR